MVVKKIAILTPVLSPYHGGIGKAALAEAEMLARNFDVTIFTPKYSYIDRDREQRGAVKIKYIKPLFSFGNAAILAGLKKELSNFDIVYLHYPLFGTAELLTYNLPLRGGIPFVGQPTTYNLVIRYHMDVVGRGVAKSLFWLHTKFIMPRILKRADKIIVSTLDYASHSNIKKLLQKQPEKFFEIPLSVDIEKFKPTGKDPELLAKYNLRASDKILLFVGGLDRAHYFKGLDCLLRAIKSLIDSQQPATYNLVVVGDGDLRPHYEDFAKNLGISGSICFVGSVSNEDLPKYYNLTDIFVFPSIDQSEAFGLALLEAISCGKAAVVSNLPGVRTLVQDGQNGFLTKLRDSHDLAEKIIQAFKNKESFGYHGQRLAEEKYSRQRITSLLLDFFNKIC